MKIIGFRRICSGSTNPYLYVYDFLLGYDFDYQDIIQTNTNNTIDNPPAFSTLMNSLYWAPI